MTTNATKHTPGPLSATERAIVDQCAEIAKAEIDSLLAENAELRIVLQELVIDAVWDGKTPIRSDGYRNFMMREQSLERARATLAKHAKATA